MAECRNITTSADAKQFTILSYRGKWSQNTDIYQWRRYSTWSFLRVHDMASALIAWCALSAVYLRCPQFPYDALIWLWVIQGSSLNPTEFSHGRISHHGNRPNTLFFFPSISFLFWCKKVFQRDILCAEIYGYVRFYLISKIISESNLKSKTALNLALLGKFQLLICNTLFLFPCDVNSTLFLIL